MLRSSILSVALLLGVAVLVGCGGNNESRVVVPVATVIQTATQVPTITQTLVPTSTPVEAIPTATVFSEVASTEEVVATLVVPATLPETALPLPENTKVVWGDGCASDGECHRFNFYWAPTHEVVMLYGEPLIKVQHELCHAHQHWSINGGDSLDPSDLSLVPWYLTAEGESFTTAVAGLPWPWTHSATNGIEDFAWTCGHWYLQPDYLQTVSPERYNWAAENLP